MSKITNDGLTRSDTGCFIGLTVGVKELTLCTDIAAFVACVLFVFNLTIWLQLR